MEFNLSFHNILEIVLNGLVIIPAGFTRSLRFGQLCSSTYAPTLIFWQLLCAKKEFSRPMGDSEYYSLTAFCYKAILSGLFYFTFSKCETSIF